MKHILVIAPTYCRATCANGQIERHFFPQLSPDEYHITILCSDRWSYILEAGGCKTLRSPFNRWLDYGCRAMMHSPFPHIGNVPDKDYYSWGKRAIVEALNLAETTHFDIIHSISMPCSSHVVAYEIKKRLHIPWIAQFYDPWAGNPFRVMKSDKMKELDLEWERLVAKEADLVIHPCDAMIDFWVEQYGEQIREKIHILPFVTEVPSFTERVRKDGEKLVISHIGSFSENRTSVHFLQGLDKLLSLHPEDRNMVSVNFVGTVTEGEKKLIDKLGLNEIVNLVGRVSEEECYKYYEASDLFLIVDIDCTPNLFYPSKIMKYFCYKKPILGLTSEKSVIRDELTATGNYPLGYNDVDGVAEFLHRAITDYQSILTNDRNHGEIFSVKNVISEYKNLLKQL